MSEMDFTVRVGSGVRSAARAWARALGAAVLVAMMAAPMPAFARGAPDSFADLADRLLPAVVNIATTHDVEAGSGEDQMIPGLPQLPPGSPFEDLSLIHI